MKNVAGYDVSRLMAGAWGTLGVVTEVSLKVLPVPPAEATLCFELSQAEALRRLQSGRSAAAAECQPLGGRPSGAADGVLHLRLRGAVAAVESACRALGGQLQSPQEAAAQWMPAASRRCRGSPAGPRAPRSGACRCRNRPRPWHCLPGPPARWSNGMAGCAGAGGASPGACAAEAARAVGGAATLFRAPAESSLVPAAGAAPAQPADAALQRIHERLRAAFDPSGIFNPGRRVAGRAGHAPSEAPHGRHRTPATNRLLGLLLAFNAGAVNAGGFLVVHSYTSHMTGFLSTVADNLVLGNMALVLAAVGTLWRSCRARAPPRSW